MICAGRVDRVIALLDALDDPILINDECGSPGGPAVLVVDAVCLRDFSEEITQQREGDADFFGELLIREKAVDADSEYLRIGRFELGNISLICLKLLGSATGECENVESNNDVLFAFEIAELQLLPGGVFQRKVRRGLAYFESGHWRGWLLLRH